MSEIDMRERYALDRHVDERSHLWLQNLQATLAARLREVAPEAVPEREEPKVVPLAPVPTKATHLRLLERLKQRKVVQWLLGYVALSWMIVQLNDALGDVWGVPLILQRAGSLALGLGIMPALVVAWYHGEKGRQQVCCVEVGLVILTLTIAFVTIWRVCFL